MVDALEEKAGRLDTGVDALKGELERRATRRRRHAALAGAVLVATAAVAFLGGAVVQRETGFATFGDPRHAWRAFAVKHYVPRLAACAAKARVDNQAFNCRVAVEPPQEVTIPLPSWWPNSLDPQQE